MNVLRTPDERFAGLEDYDFAPHYTEIADADGTPIRLHHVDEGPRDAAPVLLLHGNPTWCYLYRHWIRPLAAAGHRVVAVDLVGCGRSDKPSTRADYTLARHIDWMRKWFLAMDLRDATLFCQDWGGTLGLHLVAEFPDRFARVVAANTGIPLGEGESAFMTMWVGMMRDAVEFPLDQMIPAGMTHRITPGELGAYKAPFPDPAHQAGILQFPMLIAVQPDNPGVSLNRVAWEKLAHFDKPFLTLWGALDPVAPGGDRRLHRHIPGAAGQPHCVLPDANHFLQEDAPDELVRRLLAFVAGSADA